MRARQFAYAFGVVLMASVALPASSGFAQYSGPDPNAAPNTYKEDPGWAKLAAGRKWGAAVGVDIAPDGKSVWVFDRCATADDCSTSNLDPIQKFDASGKLVKSFGAGLFNYPHALYVDKQENVWVSDGRAKNNGKGHTVMKFSKDGKLLMTLGTPGMPGNDEKHFNAPSDVLVAPNGDIFVADRSNSRIQIFDQDGKFIADWRQFGRPSGIYINKNDILYSADSTSSEKVNAPFKQGIRIGSVKDGKVTDYIPWNETNTLEGVAADDAGNVYGGFTNTLNFRRFVKK